MIDIVQKMFDEISGDPEYTPLNAKEERKLIETLPRDEWETKLIQHNLRIPLKLISKYSNILSMDDAYQECILSMLKAVSGFETDRNLRFSTYIFWICRDSISRQLRHSKRTCDQLYHANNAILDFDFEYSEPLNTISIDVDNYSEDELKLFKEYYVNGRTISEIRKMFGWNAKFFKDTHDLLKNSYEDVV